MQFAVTSSTQYYRITYELWNVVPIGFQIVDTIDFGRFLILDEMANLAEGDTVLYTHALMNLPHEDYKVGWIFLIFFLEPDVFLLFVPTYSTNIVWHC